MSRIGLLDSFLLLALSILWGGLFIFVSVVVKALPPYTIVLLRIAVTAATLHLVLRTHHRSNLIGMEILPLRLPAEFGPDWLRLSPGDIVNIYAAPDAIIPRGRTPVTIRRKNGNKLTFEPSMAIETSVEIEVLRVGGILPLILNRSLSQTRDDDRLGTPPGWARSQKRSAFGGQADPSRSASEVCF